MMKRLLSLSLILLHFLLITPVARAQSAPRPTANRFLIVDLKGGDVRFVNGAVPSSSSLTGSFRLAFEPYPCSFTTLQVPAVTTPRVPMTVNISRAMLVIDSPSVKGLATGRLGWFLEGPIRLAVGHPNCHARVTRIAFAFAAIFRLENSANSYPADLRFVGQLQPKSGTLSGSVTGTVPDKVPVIGGLTVEIRLSFDPVPRAGLVSERGITSYSA
jgi:hypothetical protein